MCSNMSLRGAKGRRRQRWVKGSGDQPGMNSRRKDGGVQWLALGVFRY